MRLKRSKVHEVIKAGDALVRVRDLKWVEPNDFQSGKLVILIHGFTSHGIYLQNMGNFIQKFGYDVFIFNYNSYRGIRAAALSLKDYLLRYDRQLGGKISQNKLLLISHSMGGLVARTLSLDSQINPIIRGIVMLGTPNNGCFPNNRWLKYFISYGEYLTQLMPEAANPACLSAKECIKSDAPTGSSFIDELNLKWAASLKCPPTMTISGGKRFLTISRNRLKSWLANRRLQEMIGAEANDGLVTEKSIDMYSINIINLHHKYNHFNSYPYYVELNHTNLIQNQALALHIIDWFSHL